MDNTPPTMRTVTATEAKNNFGALVRRILKDKERLVIERHGIPMLILLSLQDYENLTSK